MSSRSKQQKGGIPEERGEIDHRPDGDKDQQGEDLGGDTCLEEDIENALHRFARGGVNLCECRGERNVHQDGTKPHWQQ